MPKIYIVRHGHVSPGEDDNPQLSEQGHAQARAVANDLQRRLPRALPVVTSPLQRCCQTAAPLCELWGAQPALDPRIAEVPAPPRTAMSRAEWIRLSLAVDWPEFIRIGKSLQSGFDATLANWRAGVFQAVRSLQSDTLVFSHFVPINVLTGHCTNSERVACFLPDHTSVSVFEITDGQIRLLERGRERARLPG